ncbi:hypothetical protein GCM10028827_27840 [Mucilaginibacter myungsuensis]
MLTGIGARGYQLSRSHFDIDVMTDALAPVAAQIAIGTTIGYYADEPSDALYNEAAYILAPVILSKNMGKDTVLYIHKRDLPLKQVPGHQAFLISETEQYQLILTKKTP